jgi:hypothetical protein
LRRDVFGGLVEESIERTRATYERWSPVEWQRGWRFQLAHSERLYIGSYAWRLSFGAWPVLPVLDRRLLDTVGQLGAALAGRGAQDEILRSRFPAIARIPVVRNNSRIDRPVLASLPERLAWRLVERSRATLPLRTTLRALRRRRERRYNYFLYDFSGPGWREIRERAEGERDRVSHLFVMEEFDRFLPPPAERVEVDDGIVDIHGRKLLVGLLLWSRDHPL